MINKMVTREINKLKDKTEELIRDPNFMYELIQRESQSVKDNAKIEELKSELTYWKETAEHYKKEFEKLKQKCWQQKHRMVYLIQG